MTHRSGSNRRGNPPRVRLRDDTEVIVAGYARLFGRHLDIAVRDSLEQGLGRSADGDFGAVFTYIRDPDGEPARWTIFTADTAWAERLASTGGGRSAIPLSEIMRQFPRVRPAWLITDG